MGSSWSPRLLLGEGIVWTLLCFGKISPSDSDDFGLIRPLNPYI